MAKRLTLEESSKSATTDSPSTTSASTIETTNDVDEFIPLPPNGGRVRFEELDAEKMEARFLPESFDCVWISEALSHFPDKALFFRNAARVLRPGKGKLVIADWFKAEGLDGEAIERDIKAIEGTNPGGRFLEADMGYPSDLLTLPRRHAVAPTLHSTGLRFARRSCRTQSPA